MLLGRRLEDPPLPGAVNMARDELLLELQRAPTLRFYRWAQPTLSLGYFQPAAGLPLEAVRARGGEVVRRRTGGKAILHEHELTYSLCAPETGRLAGGPGCAIARVHDALGLALSGLAGTPVTRRGERLLASDRPGSPWCFEDSSALDLVLDDRKLLGSAARRRGGWILLHGSLVLKAPAETPDIAALGPAPGSDLTPLLAAALEEFLGLALEPARWPQADAAAAAAAAAGREADRTAAVSAR